MVYFDQCTFNRTIFTLGTCAVEVQSGEYLAVEWGLDETDPVTVLRGLTGVLSAAGLSLIISSLPLTEAELLDCETKSDSSLEREPAEDDSKGADGVKKRKRKPYRPGRAPDPRRQLS